MLFYNANKKPSDPIFLMYQVSAGMKALLELQLYAIAVGVQGESGQGSIGHHVEIITEMEQLFLPVTANILLKYFKRQIFFFASSGLNQPDCVQYPGITCSSCVQMQSNKKLIMV